MTYCPVGLSRDSLHAHAVWSERSLPNQDDVSSIPGRHNKFSRIGLLNENTHDSLQLWVSCLRTDQADLMKKNPIS